MLKIIIINAHRPNKFKQNTCEILKQFPKLIETEYENSKDIVIFIYKIQNKNLEL